MNSFIVTDNGLSLSIGMQPYSVDKSHPNYTKILDAVKAQDWNEIPDLFDVTKSVIAYGGGKIDVNTEQGTVQYNGEDLDNTLTDRILRMMNEGFSIEPLTNLVDNMMQNTSMRAVKELYPFLEFGKMPITEDGHFLAYKRVRGDYKSVHDGKTDNSVGTIVEMPRNKVDEDKDRTCSHGLHFCSHGYLSNFSGEKVVVLKVNPRDVVAIPADYNNTKGRACRYEVVGELSPAEVEKAMHDGLWGSSVISDYDDADRDFDGEDGEDNDNDVEYANHDDLPFDNSDFGDADGDLDEPSEAQSSSYVRGYNDGYAKGRVPGSTTDDTVIVSYYVESTEEYVAGFERGFKDGKGHKAKARLAPVVADVPTDNETFSNDDYDQGYKDGYDDGYNGNMEGDVNLAGQDYRDGYEEGYKNGEIGRVDDDALDQRHGGDGYGHNVQDYEPTEVQSPSYVANYNEGYTDGHNKDSFALPQRGVRDINHAAGYVRGFKDGRGHKAKVKFAS